MKSVKVRREHESVILLWASGIVQNLAWKAQRSDQYLQAENFGYRTHLFTISDDILASRNRIGKFGLCGLKVWRHCGVGPRRKRVHRGCGTNLPMDDLRCNRVESAVCLSQSSTDLVPSFRRCLLASDNSFGNRSNTALCWAQARLGVRDGWSGGCVAVRWISRTIPLGSMKFAYLPAAAAIESTAFCVADKPETVFNRAMLHCRLPIWRRWATVRLLDFSFFRLDTSGHLPAAPATEPPQFETTCSPALIVSDSLDWAVCKLDVTAGSDLEVYHVRWRFILG